jgi:hypothetical protein
MSSNTKAANYEFYTNSKRFKADSSDDERSLTSSPTIQHHSAESTSMPLQSIANKLNAKQPIDFATAYSNYYQSPQAYNNYYANQYATQQYQNPHPNQYPPIYPNYQATFQNHRALNNITNPRSSIGNSSSSADSSSISLNLNSPTSQLNDNENVSPIQQHVANQNVHHSGYNSLGLKESTVATNILDESTSSFGGDDTLNGVKNKGIKRRPVPVEHKDNSYWEKRRKNNESAKRSRDLRRCKEEHISVRVIYLEQENLQLRTENALMRSEVEKLRAMLYANTN